MLLEGNKEIISNSSGLGKTINADSFNQGDKNLYNSCNLENSQLLIFLFLVRPFYGNEKEGTNLLFVGLAINLVMS